MLGYPAIKYEIAGGKIARPEIRIPVVLPVVRGLKIQDVIPKGSRKIYLQTICQPSRGSPVSPDMPVGYVVPGTEFVIRRDIVINPRRQAGI